MKKITAAILSLSLAACTGCSEKVVPHASVKVETGDALPESYAGVSGSSTSTGKNSKTKTTTTTAAAETTDTKKETTTKPVSPPADLVLNGLAQVEVYQEINLENFITEKNVQLKDSSILLDTADLGEHKIEVEYISNGNEFKKELKYNVADTTPPLIINEGWDTRHVLGTAFDLNEYIGYGDNYDKKPSMSYTGDVDINTAGNYPLHVVVSDSSGNTSEFDVNIQVLHALQEKYLRILETYYMLK